MGGLFEIRRPRSTGWKDFGRRWTRGVGGLEFFLETLLNIYQKTALYCFHTLSDIQIHLNSMQTLHIY